MSKTYGINDLSKLLDDHGFQIHQGTELNDHSFVTLITDKEDIQERAKEYLSRELTTEELDKAYQRAKSRLADSIIETQYWFSIEAIIDEAIKR